MRRANAGVGDARARHIWTQRSSALATSRRKKDDTLRRYFVLSVQMEPPGPGRITIRPPKYILSL